MAGRLELSVTRSYVGLLDAALLRPRPRTSEFRSMRRRRHAGVGGLSFESAVD